jgi:hypothetical protein
VNRSGPRDVWLSVEALATAPEIGGGATTQAGVAAPSRLDRRPRSGGAGGVDVVLRAAIRAAYLELTTPRASRELADRRFR